MIQKVNNFYQLKEQIGEGAFGKVYCIVDDSNREE